MHESDLQARHETLVFAPQEGVRESAKHWTISTQTIFNVHAINEGYMKNT
jgi:hypothetical protein